jgi:methylated-DNA-[protein]-cysteine S-methyltransferase
MQCEHGRTEDDMHETTLFVERLATPVGEVLVVTDDEDRAWAVEWVDREARLRARLARHCGDARVPLLPTAVRSRAHAALAAYFEGDTNPLDAVEVIAAGTPFQRAVWDALRALPPGRPCSYGALAARLGRPSAVRAVAQANAANPIAIVVPCHRVIGADRSLTGYAGGLPRKRWLLEHEAHARAAVRREACGPWTAAPLAARPVGARRQPSVAPMSAT